MRYANLFVCSGLCALFAVACVLAEDKEDRKPDVRYVPTPPEVMAKMLEVAKITRKDVVYDLGCGDGRIVCTAARQYKCKAVGFDIDPERIKDSEANKGKEAKEIQSLITFKKQDIFTLDLREATVILLYLRPELNVKLIPQLEKLAPGSRIVSHSWDMRGVRPDEGFPIKVKKSDGYQRDVYRWTTPLEFEKRP